MLSIIIPTLNESATIGVLLSQLLHSLKDVDHEIIVVDGGSQDDTVNVAKSLIDQVIISSQKGRAIQMNTGAEHASGQYLLFLHSDTKVPVDFHLQIKICGEKPWGFFRVKLSGNEWLFRLIEFMMNIRSRISCIATGDQGLFITKKYFKKIQGFAPIPIMEDVEICKRLRREHKPYIISSPLVTSSRRWQQKGILKTVFLMWSLRLAYFCGVSPHRLVSCYSS